ncbi:MAG TPA: YCF48-related protein [Pirellulales bacterium]|nr:YCF48-related protein [Pirellulales bacterium]
MDGPFTRRFALQGCLAIVLMIVTAAGGAGAAGPADPPHVREMQEDAELVDVSFVDTQHGWAVGDRGVIWVTADGGKRWRLQPAGVNCRLSSVQFLDAENGWAAGGMFHPYTHTSRGILLRTRDGGRSWAQDKGLMLPSLRRVRFLTGNVGWAYGESSALFPSGVFVTDDAGRTWSPLEGLEGPGWLAADFVDPLSGAIAGRRGSLAAIRRRGLKPARTPDFGLRGLNRMKLTGETEGWLVGDGGLVLTTVDLGLSWQLPPDDPSAVVGSDFDWHALEVRGSRVWIAGSPGTKVLFSGDGGKSWQAFDTGQNLPLYALTFIDNLHGWAVGAMGTILATADGGQTWQRQHSGGTRAALLAVVGRPDDVSMELLARLSAGEGYLGAVEILVRGDDPNAGASSRTEPERSRAAVIGAGGSAAQTAWSFPLPESDVARTAEQIVEAWDKLNDGEGIDRVEAHVIKQIRCWRPEVVVTHAASLGGENPAGHVMNQIVLEAVERAADPTRFPEQLAQMGLEAWRVRKVFGRLPDGQLGDVNLSTAQLAPRLAESLADHAAGPRGLIGREFRAPPPNVGFRLYVDTLPQHVGEHDFFSGIALHPGGDARRTINEFSTQSADALRRMAQKQRNVQAIIARSEQGQLDSARYAAQIGDLTSDLDSSTAGNVIYQLAQHYRESGKWPLAAETFSLLAQQHPDHPLTEAALVWLVRYWSSSECAWRERRAALSVGRQAAASQVASQLAVFQPPTALGQVLPSKNQVAARGDGASADRPPVKELPGNAPQVEGQTMVVDYTLSDDRAERAAALGKLLEQRSPATFAEPEVRFALAAAHRTQGLTKQAEKYYFDVTRLRHHDAWWACAAGERWLDDPQEVPPKDVLHVPSGPKPRLDGQLDDDIWQRAGWAELQPASLNDDEAAAKAKVAYDGEFLYLAIACKQASAAEYPVSQSPRPRDADLSQHDRVDVFLDLDRDWSTWYRFTVDHRGWTGEACWDDAGWDPQWFVAAAARDGVWTVEAAIPLAELSGEMPKPRYVWAVGIQRTVPGVGFQSWTRPASASVTPEGFGYLIFD